MSNFLSDVARLGRRHLYSLLAVAMVVFLVARIWVRPLIGGG